MILYKVKKEDRKKERKRAKEREREREREKYSNNIVPMQRAFYACIYNSL